MNSVKEEYKKSDSWTERVLLIEVYHLSRLNINKHWTLKQTANYFEVSIGLISENLRLAELLHKVPEASRAESREKALKIMRRRKWANI